MRKKTRRILIIIMAVILAFVCFFLYSTTGKRSDIKERNEIKATVEKALRITYGWTRNENIKDIATIQCQKQLKEDDFYERLTFYMINRDFMDTCYEEGPNKVRVCVELYDPDLLFAIFTLEKTKEGKYLITRYECDV